MSEILLLMLAFQFAFQPLMTAFLLLMLAFQFAFQPLMPAFLLLMLAFQFAFQPLMLDFLLLMLAFQFAFQPLMLAFLQLLHPSSSAFHRILVALLHPLTSFVHNCPIRLRRSHVVHYCPSLSFLSPLLLNLAYLFYHIFYRRIGVCLYRNSAPFSSLFIHDRIN